MKYTLIFYLFWNNNIYITACHEKSIQFENVTVPAFPFRFVKFLVSPQKQNFWKRFCFLWDVHCYLVHYSISNQHYHPMLTLLLRTWETSVRDSSSCSPLRYFKSFRWWYIEGPNCFLSSWHNPFFLTSLVNMLARFKFKIPSPRQIFGNVIEDSWFVNDNCHCKILTF